MDSVSSFGGSYHASVSCASAEEESSFLKRARFLHWIRLGLSAVIFSVSVSIIGCEAVPLLHYRRTSAFERSWLFLWPLNFDLRPTIALLSCGCVVAFQTILYIVTTLLPSPRSHIRRLNLFAAVVAISGFIAALVGIVLAIHLPSSSALHGFARQETLHSWTCKWKSVRGTPSINLDNTLATPPSHFARDCATTRAAFIMMGLLVGLEIIMGIAVGAGIWFERNVSKQRGQDMPQTEKVEMVPKYPGT